jgi:hypothetical protein
VIDGNPVAFDGPSLTVQAERSGLIVTAHAVASELVQNDYNIPVKFLACRGRVNSATFLGQAAGTMLLQGYRFVKRPQPIATQSLGRLLFGLNIEMHFGFTDPPRADVAETHRGWLLVPGPYGPTGGEGWYYCETPTAKALYVTKDFNGLLTHWSLNDL